MVTKRGKYEKKIESGRQMVPEDGTGVPRVGSIVNMVKTCALLLKSMQSHTGCIFLRFQMWQMLDGMPRVGLLNTANAAACA